MNEPVSVIIPTWNRAESLKRAIGSVLRQTLPVAEILVCDDGSADHSRQVVAAFEHPRLHWLAGPRGGRPAIPRNRGILASRGKWLAFLDDDDEWFPEKLERQLAQIERLGVLAACTNALRIQCGQEVCSPVLQWPLERLTFGDILEVNRVVCSSVLVSRALLDRSGFFPEAPEMMATEDYALWLKLAAMTDFAYLDEPLLNYLDDPENSIRKDGAGYLAMRKSVLEDFLAWSSRANVSRWRRKMVAKHYRQLMAQAHIENGGGLKRFIRKFMAR